MRLSRRAFLSAPVLAAAQASPRPNILWVSIEDSSPQLGCYGDRLAVTPNIDALAREGVRFTNAYATIGVCAPCRSSIITGMFPPSIGTQHMRSNAQPPEHVKCFPEYLRRAGYYCTNNSKTDYNFPVPKQAWDASNAKAHWKNRPAGAPFFAVFNLVITHESQILHRGAAHEKVTPRLKPNERSDPARVPVPPYYIDTPEVRRDLANVYDNLTQMDYEAGDLLRELKTAGLDDDTIVFFWSDHGVGLPRSKRWLYQSSTHVPLIARIPEKFRQPGQGNPGTTNDELVSLMDLGPTMLNLAGVPVPEHMQSRAFLGANLTPKRRYVYGFRDRMDERYDMVRSVCDGRYRYIRNFDFHQPHYQFMNTSEENATMAALRQAHDAGKLPPQIEKYFQPKPHEELYDVTADPHEMTNLAAANEHKAKLESLRAECVSWMRSVKDTGLIPEQELDAMGKRYGTRHAILRAPENSQLLDKLLAVANAAQSGNAKPILAALSDAAPAVRQRAAMATAMLPKMPKGAEAKLRPLLKDQSAGVRVAAAYALVDIAVLRQELTSPEEWTRLNAALALDQLGEKARPAIDDLRARVKADANRYVARVANRAVNKLTGENNKVPGGFSLV